MIPLIFFLSIHSSFLPWDNDGSMCYRQENRPPCKTTPFVGDSLIKFHRGVISEADGPRSNFYPSSSQYTYEAMQRHGFLKGYLMGCDRLTRENKERWVYRITEKQDGTIMKWDPVENF